MIPVRLRLTNFMCYRGEGLELDFRGIHLACLSGQNGHGKSALLDAITWALWGKARTAHDNDLITLGEDEMEVELDFALSGNLYRVLRKRSSGGRGRSSLDLQVEHEGRFNPLTEGSLRQTQERITELLRLDYDTFINSAFLLQGRANEFTTKSPADRKRILGEILGLSIYDTYEQQARLKARDAESGEQNAAARLAEIDRELAFEEQHRQELGQAERDVSELAEQGHRVEEEVSALRQEKRALDLQAKQHEDLERRIARAEREQQALQQQLASHERRLAQGQSVLDRRAEIEASHAALQEAQAAERALGDKLSALMPLSQRRSDCQRQIDREKGELEAEGRLARARLAELEAKADQREKWTQSLAEVRARLAALAEQESEREAKREEIQQRTAESASLQALNQRLRGEMDEIKERLELLRAAEAKCPLCGSPLTGEHRDRVLDDLAAEGKASGDRYRENAARIAVLEKESATLQQQARRLERSLSGRGAAQREEAALESSLAEAERAAQEAVAAREQLAALEQRLAEGGYAQKAKEQLAQVEAEVAGLGYDADAHERARQQVEALGRAEGDYQALQVAAGTVDEAREAIRQAEAALGRWAEGLEKDRQQLAELASALAGLEQVERRLREGQSRLAELRERDQRARLALGAAQQKLEHCRVLRADRARQQERLDQLIEDKGLYRDLQTAFGQKGLRAMLIEAAIPEIEEEANLLLARMTENRMHLRFDTQRETLKGDTVETLQIKIADELGTRDYEMYSGGEAFRVDFAIRIALSKLLARRAGAQLQTLVMDEGFGTQDAQGRERLVEAINAIKDDFACILVITHIEELQDAFPVRINVTKTPEGSRFEIG